MLKFLAQQLTSRELEVLALVASGASAKEIARQLKITSRTVETHINHLKLKTRSRNRAHLVAVALEEALIDNPCHMLRPNPLNTDSNKEAPQKGKTGMLPEDQADDRSETF